MIRNNRRNAFTLVELLGIILAIALFIALLLPAMSSPRGRGHRKMYNSTQVRGIHTSCVLYSQDNRDLYPGLSIDSKRSDSLIDATEIDHAIDDSSASHARLQILANEHYFVGEYMLGPTEQRPVWREGQTVTRDHTSYALLNITDPEDDKFRRKEWTNTTNDAAVVICDRALTPDAPFDPDNVDNDKNIQSIWTKKPGDWKGSVGWNDNHTTFEVSHIIETTQYGETTNQNDSLFRYDDTPDTSANAFMIWGKGIDTSK